MKKQKHDDKPQFQTSRDLVAHAAHRFLVMLEQRLNGEKRPDDASYFRMPDGRDCDELVAQLQGREEPAADPEKAKGSSDFLQSYGKKMRARVEREQADKLRPATRTERRYAVEGIDPKVARESGE